jgi:Fic family protein
VEEPLEGVAVAADRECPDLVQALREPVLAGLVDETVRDYVDWDQLAVRRLPPGLGMEETWELLGVVRHLGSTTFPIPTLDGRAFWYNLNREGDHCLAFVRRHCRAESPLHRTMQEKEGQRFLVRSRIQEAIATCQLDGIDIAYGRAGRMLQEGRTPQTSAERLVLNSYDMLRELESLAPEPFSPDFVRSLYDRLTFGVDLSDIARGPRKSNLAGTLNPAGMSGEARDRGILGDICDFANGKTGDPSESAAIKTYMILSAMGYWQPLPDLNETVGRHMLRLFAVKRDYPVLGYLSTSLTMLKWFEGSLNPGVARFSTLRRRPVLPGMIDGTEDILTHLQLTTAAVGGLLDHIARTRKQDAALQAAIENQEQLNYRQRSVLVRALAHPNAEFRIRPHQMAHHVVYQTARADLLELEARGYLRREIRGKAFAFAAVPDLQERLRRGADCGGPD